MNPELLSALVSPSWPVAVSPEALFQVTGDIDEHRTGVVGLILRGELDAAVADQLSGAARLLLQLQPPGPAGRLAYLELTGLTFLDTAGLDRLAHATDVLRAGGRRIVTVGAHGQVRRVLDIATQRGWLTVNGGPPEGWGVMTGVSGVGVPGFSASTPGAVADGHPDMSQLD